MVHPPALQPLVTTGFVPLSSPTDSVGSKGRLTEKRKSFIKFLALCHRLLFASVIIRLSKTQMLARPTGILMSEQHLKPGDQAPNVTLLTKDGKSVQIANFWAEGPTLLVFLRHFG
jgi:hypothetical protein